MLTYFAILKDGVYLPDSITYSILDAKSLFDKLCSRDPISEYEIFILNVKLHRVFGSKDQF